MSYAAEIAAAMQYKADADTSTRPETRSEYVTRKRQERLDSLPPHLRAVVIAKQKRQNAAAVRRLVQKRRALTPTEIATKVREFVRSRGASKSGDVVSHLRLTSGLLHAAVQHPESGLKIVEKAGKPDGGGRRGRWVTTADDPMQPSPPPRDAAEADAIRSRQRDEWNKRQRRAKYAAERPTLYPQFAHPLLSHSDAAAAMTQAYRRLPPGHPLRHTLTRLHNHGEMAAAVAVQEAARRGDLEADRDYQPALATVADDLYDRLSSEGPAIEERVKRSRPLADWDYYKQLNDYYGGSGATDTAKPRREDGSGGEQPVAFAAYRAPKGGVVVRGLYYGGGSLVPDLQKFAAADADARPTKRQRLLATLRKRLKPKRYQRERPRRYSSHFEWHNALTASDREDTLPARVYADYIEEGGQPAVADFIRHHADEYQRGHTTARYRLDVPDDSPYHAGFEAGKPYVMTYPHDGTHTVVSLRFKKPSGLRHTDTVVGFDRRLPDADAHALLRDFEGEGVQDAYRQRIHLERYRPHLTEGSAGVGAD